MNIETNGDEIFDRLQQIKHLDLKLRGEIAEVSINNPPHNYLTLDILDELQILYHYVTTARENKDFSIRAIIITGGGRAFSGGVSFDIINSLKEKKDQEYAEKRLRAAIEMFEKLPMPVVAAINGICLGGGLELALACHYRVSSKGAYFGFPEIKHGFIPGLHGPYMLTRLIGRSKAQRLIVSGKLITAEEAFQMGIIDEVVDKNDVMNSARMIAREMSEHNPKATEYALIAINAALHETREKCMNIESELFWDLIRDRLAVSELSQNEASIQFVRKTNGMEIK